MRCITRTNLLEIKKRVKFSYSNMENDVLTTMKDLWSLYFAAFLNNLALKLCGSLCMPSFLSFAYWSWVELSVFYHLFTDYQCWCLFSILCLLIMSVDVFVSILCSLVMFSCWLEYHWSLHILGYLDKKLWRGWVFSFVEYLYDVVEGSIIDGLLHSDFHTCWME